MMASWATGATTGHNFAVQVENLVENLNDVIAVGGGVAHSLVAGSPATLLTVVKVLEHPDENHFRLFNLTIDGVVVAANINSGSSGPQRVSPGNHTVSETGGTDTSLHTFFATFGGDCAAAGPPFDGTVNLALGDQKTCIITNFDNEGGCAIGQVSAMRALVSRGAFSVLSRVTVPKDTGICKLIG
jgi:hypothetical protein